MSHLNQDDDHNFLNRNIIDNPVTLITLTVEKIQMDLLIFWAFCANERKIFMARIPLIAKAQSSSDWGSSEECTAGVSFNNSSIFSRSMSPTNGIPFELWSG